MKKKKVEVKKDVSSLKKEKNYVKNIILPKITRLCSGCGGD